MKKILTFLGGLILFYCPVFSQSVEVNDLTAPAAPAFTILGIQPNEISKPKSYKALETALLSSFSKGNSLQVPSNFSLEVTPYWLKSRDDNFQTVMSGSESWRKTASFSIATTEVEDKTNTANNFRRMGLGFRTTLVPGELRNNFEADLAGLMQLSQVLGCAKLALQQLKADVATEWNNYNSGAGGTLDKITFRQYFVARFNACAGVDVVVKGHLNNFLKKIDRILVAFKPTNQNEFEVLLDEINDKINDLDKDIDIKKAAAKVERHHFYRKGLKVDIASALALDFPTNDINYSIDSKKGIWITPSWSFLKNKTEIELLSVLRILWNKFPQTTVNKDMGLRGIISSGKFSLSAEGIYRFQKVTLSEQPTGSNTVIETTEKKQDVRWVGSLTYHISEKIVLVYSFGKNFSINTEFKGNLISLLGVNFGLQGPKVSF